MAAEAHLWKAECPRLVVRSVEASLLLILSVLTGSQEARGQEPDSAAPDSVVANEVYTASDLANSASFDFLDTMRRLAPSIWVEQVTVGALRPGLRPFHLRGLGPDHVLVRINGVRRLPMPLVHGSGSFIPGSSGVDLNAIPRLALERGELHDGEATARYGSGAVAGVLDLRLRSGVAPLTVEAHTGKHFPEWFDDDGWKGRVAANWGFELPGLGGALNLTGEYLRRTPTSRAGPSDRDQFEEDDGDRLEQLDDDPLLEIAEKRNPVPQPTFHVGDGFYENRMVWGTYERPAGDGGELYLWGGWSDRTDRHSNFFRRPFEPDNWPQVYPMGFLPTFDVDTRDVQVTAGIRGRWGGWKYDAHASLARNRIDAEITNTLNASLGPCLSTPCAPGEDGEPGTADDPGIPNQPSFYLGSLTSGRDLAALDVTRRFRAGSVGPLTLSLGAELHREVHEIENGEPASYIDGEHANQYGGLADPGVQGAIPWRPEDARADRRLGAAVHATAEARPVESLQTTSSVRVATYEGIGTLGAADLGVVYRLVPDLAANLSGGLGYRVPGVATGNWSHTWLFQTFPLGPYIGGEFPVDAPAARALGARALDAERTRSVTGGVEIGPLAGVELSARGYFTRIVDGVVLSDRLEPVLRLLEDVAPEVGSVRYSGNFLDLDTYGADLRISYRHPFGDEHDIRLRAGFHLNRVAIQKVNPPFDPLSVGSRWVGPETMDRIEHGRPTEAGIVSARYRWSGFELSLRGRYFGEMKCLTNCDFNRATDTLGTWPSKATMDAELGYRFDNGVEISLGGQNLTDVMPEPNPSLLHPPSGTFDKIFWPGSPYPWMNGRYLYLSTRWTLD